MSKLFIALVAIASILFSVTGLTLDANAAIQPPRLDDKSYYEISISKAIPDWVKNQFDWYLKGEIDEGTLLTSMNWMFDNNIMHLSQKAALEVKQLRDENEKYKELLGHELTHTIQQGSSGSKGSNQTSTGERVMQPEFGASQNKVIVRGWDPEKKEEIVGTPKSVARFVVELYAESMSLSGVLWLPMTEGEVLVGHTDGDPDRPIIIGRIYNESSKVDSFLGTLSSGTGKSSPIEEIKTVSETVENILGKGGSTSVWKEKISSYSIYSTQKGVRSNIESVVLFSNAIEIKTQKIGAELEIISQWIKIISENQAGTYDASGKLTSDNTKEYVVQYRESDFNFITGKLSSIDQQIKTLETGIAVLKENLSSVGEDSQMDYLDLQNSLQKQQRGLQTLSNILKASHDAAMNSIRNMK